MASKLGTKLVLATQSPYKRQLLSRLVGDFVTDPSGIDESPLAGEIPLDQAARLAEAKAREVAPRHAGAWIVGADQLAELDGRAVGKQPTAEQAQAMLMSLSRRALNFHTAVCVLDPAGNAHAHTDLTVARFRTLDRALVERYLALDAPYDCTAAFRAEGAGPLLLEALETADPTAIVGLPLIWLASVLPLD
ncbi:MAG: Maf family protein [Gammaproteobacteria bacterium]|nr:Maf family protein [Gammaproteobacteria bacterium]